MRINNDETAIKWLDENDVVVALTAENTVKIEKCCSRCGGSGYWARGHHNRNGICFKCEGTGNRYTDYVPVKAYAQKLKREKVAREKRKLEWAAKKAAKEERMLEGQRNWCEKNGYGRVTFEEKAEIEKAKRAENQKKMVYLGEKGEVLELTVTYLKTFSFDSFYGTCFIHKFSDENGNVLIWKTSVGLRYPDEIYEGDKVEIKGRIKELNEYRGEKQTVLTRCKVKKVS